MASQSLAYKGLVVVLNCGTKPRLHGINEPLGTTGIYREPAVWSQPRLSPQNLALSQILLFAYFLALNGIFIPLESKKPTTLGTLSPL